MTPDRELELLRFLDGLYAQLKATREAPKALRHAVRAARDFLKADGACLAVVHPGESKATALESVGIAGWDLDMLGAFIRKERPAIAEDLMVAPVKRRGREWAALALYRANGSFERGSVRPLLRISAVITECLGLIDRERMLGVRDQIDRKIAEQLRPQDLFYEILHGLRSLTRYDHSSALLIREDGDGHLRLVAEQIAWKKGKSRRIGQKFTLSSELGEILGRGAVCGFNRTEGGTESATTGEAWSVWTPDEDTAPLAHLLDYNGSGARDKTPGARGANGTPEAHEAREASMLCAPLSGRDGIFGVLKISGCHPGAFGAYEVDLLERFRSQAAVAIQNSQRTEVLQSRMLEAEKKHAMADLARSVAHDVNNALGSVLPIVEQISEDARAGRCEPDVLAADAEQIRKSLQVCRRIFGGMVSFARGGSRRTSDADFRMALEGTLAIVRDGLERRAVTIVTEIHDELPRIAGGQSDLEQILLNVLTNARDAMGSGGRLTIRASASSVAGAGSGTREVEIAIEDTGPGIAPEVLPHVVEPFFTTKREGTGLGLAICRSIVWEMGGKFTIDSVLGQGTTVTIVVPSTEKKS